MSIWKRAGISILAIIMLCCVVVDAFWVYIKFFAPEKTVISTYNFDTIETVANEDAETTEDYILKVKYYSNDNNNGYEAIEVMINSFYDESMTNIKSYGVQVVTYNCVALSHSVNLRTINELKNVALTL